MRRCADRIEVLAPYAGGRAVTAVTTATAATAESVAAPLAFRWRGRRYVVSDVLADWIEVEPWWTAASQQSSQPASQQSAPESEQRWWRVEARRRLATTVSGSSHDLAHDPARGLVTGVFDLCWSNGTWSMRSVVD